MKQGWMPEFWQGSGWYAQQTWVRQDGEFDSPEAPEPFWAEAVYEIGIGGGVPDGCELAIDYLGDGDEPESDGERFWFDPEAVPDACRGRYPEIAPRRPLDDEPVKVDEAWLKVLHTLTDTFGPEWGDEGRD